MRIIPVFYKIQSEYKTEHIVCIVLFLHKFNVDIAKRGIPS